MAERFKEISKKTTTTRAHKSGKTREVTIGGKVAANQTFACLRTIYNYARKFAETLPPDSPAFALTFHRFRPRQDGMDTAALKAWHAKVALLENPLHRAYLLMVLLSGGRRREVAQARWSHIDWEARVWRFPETKTIPWLVPLSQPMVRILERLKSLSNAHTPDTPWLFPALSKSGHIEQPQKRKQMGASIHDLKHCYTTAATSVGVPKALLDILTNHAGSGMTEGVYTTRSALLESLRDYQESISKTLLKDAPKNFGLTPTPA